MIAAAAAAMSLSCVQLGATPETAAHQAPLSLGFSREEHWSGLPFLYVQLIFYCYGRSKERFWNKNMLTGLGANFVGFFK